MKTIFKLALCYFMLVMIISDSLVASDEEVAIGSEFITPLRYPKLLISGDYIFLQSFVGFEDSALRSKSLSNKFGATVSFETGLMRYLNAGGNVSASIPNNRAAPFDMRAMIFAKPLFLIGDRVSLFARIGGGLAWSNHGSLLHELRDDPDFDAAYQRVYKDQQYRDEHFGAAAALSVGAEWFFFSRIGVAVEFGVRASIFRHTINFWFEDEKPRVAGTPSGINYVVYEFPLSVTIQGIL